MDAARKERRAHRRVAKKQARSANDVPAPNFAPNFASVLSPACVPAQSWTPLSSGPAPRAIPSSPAPSSASSVVSSSSYASMMSGASLPVRAPFAPMDFNAAAANSSIARAAPFETLRLAYTGGASASSSPAGRTQRPYGKAAARAPASSSPAPAAVAPAASLTAGSAAATAALPATSAIRNPLSSPSTPRASQVTPCPRCLHVSEADTRACAPGPAGSRAYDALRRHCAIARWRVGGSSHAPGFSGNSVSSLPACLRG